MKTLLIIIKIYENIVDHISKCNQTFFGSTSLVVIQRHVRLVGDDTFGVLAAVVISRSHHIAAVVIEFPSSDRRAPQHCF